MKITKTYFQSYEIYQAPWIIPGTTETYQIDHILNESKHRRNLTDARCYRGANANT